MSASAEGLGQQSPVQGSGGSGCRVEGLGLRVYSLGVHTQSDRSIKGRYRDI